LIKFFYAHKALCITLAILLLAGIILGIVLLCINAHVKNSVKKSIIPIDEMKNEGYNFILVLGAGIKDDGTPSDVLRDRLLVAIDLYKRGIANKLLMSGDHGRKHYDEVGAMREFAISHGVNENDIYLDHAGFSTYESIYRAKEIFGAKRIIIVTQKYHLYRALYLAKQFDIEAKGVSADLMTYRNQAYFSSREALARIKDYFYAIFKPLPTYLGEKIEIK